MRRTNKKGHGNTIERKKNVRKMRRDLNVLIKMARTAQMFCGGEIGKYEEKGGGGVGWVKTASRK